MNTTIAVNDTVQSNETDSGLALVGSIVVTSLVMVAIVRWAASGAGYGSLLASLGIATASSLLLGLALWAVPSPGEGAREPLTPARSRAT